MNKLPDIDLDLDLDLDELGSEIDKLEKVERSESSISMTKSGTRQRTAIIGGMGNEAMLDLMEKMTTQDISGNLEYIFYGNSHLAYTPGEMSKLADKKVRSEADTRKKHTFNHTLALLQHLGCNAVGMSCNSGHTFIREIIPRFDLELIDMVKEACYVAQKRNLPIILGTTSLIEDKLYEIATDNKSVHPRATVLRKIMSSVYHPQRGVKSSGVNEWNFKVFKEALRDSLSFFNSSQAIILGCTELPLFFKYKNGQIFKDIPKLERMDIIDPTMILAERLITTSFGHTPREISHSQFRMPKSDIYPPLAFKCDTILDAIRIQRDILSETGRVLKDRYPHYKKGSYLHLPTMFFVNCDPEIPKDFFDSVVKKEDLAGYSYKNKIRKHIEYIIRTNENAIK